MDSLPILKQLRDLLRHAAPAAVFALIFYLVLLPRAAAAGASLYLFPPSGTYQVGENFTVSLRLSSGDNPVNAAEGALIFNPAEIRVAGISKNGSAFNLWTTDPVFSNAAGTITFGGGTTSSYNGSSGTVLTITFASKSATVSQVSFSSGSVLAADGKGTNILSNMNGGAYTFRPAVVLPAPEKTPGQVEQPGVLGTPYAPVVTSATHPDPEIWYANNSPEFSWEVPDGISAVRTKIDQKPYSTPDKEYPAESASAKIDDLNDGIWYFHVQFKNSVGWGAILHRKVMIDTNPPLPFGIAVDNGGDPTNPTPTLQFGAKDAVSGISYYEIKIGQLQPLRLQPQDPKDTVYQVSVQPPGTQTVIVKAYDLAQNTAVAITEIVIQPLETPSIDPLPASMHDGELLTVSGATKYQQAEVLVFIQKEGELPSEQDAVVGADGRWVSVFPKSLTKGAYQIWARVRDSRGAQSLASQKMVMAVQPLAVVRVGTFIVDYFGAIMTLIGVIIIITALICAAIFMIDRMRRRLRSRTAKLSKKIYYAFGILRQELLRQIQYLDGQPGLTDNEQVVHDKLKKALDESEKFIGKEIEEIEKELK